MWFEERDRDFQSMRSEGPRGTPGKTVAHHTPRAYWAEFGLVQSNQASCSAVTRPLLDVAKPAKHLQQPGVDVRTQPGMFQLLVRSILPRHASGIGVSSDEFDQRSRLDAV